METWPCAAFEVIESDLAFKLLIVTLDAPAELEQPDKFLDRGGVGQRAKHELVGFELAVDPFANEPMLLIGGPASGVHFSRSNTDESESG